MNRLINSLAILSTLCLIFISKPGFAQNTDNQTDILVFEIKDEIAKPAWRTTQKAFEQARQKEVDYVLLHMNTYGGRVDIADSIRTVILNSDIPVIAFINNQAISAGALISIACDSIYMRPGGSIGAATVVSQSGEQVPDKYQSFMRSTMRATAEAHGKDTIIKNGDTTLIWHRDPKVAESMVDPRLYVKNISDSGQVLTLTAEEAMRVNYCEGLAKDIPEVLKNAGLEGANMHYYKPAGVDKLILFLLSPVVQSILIIMIFGGIYFELQSPGIGFPLGIALLGAIVYFAPLYMEGLAQNWELLAFIAGLVLLALEIFVIPGFGVAGVSGIVLIVVGLSMSMVDNVIFEFEGIDAFGQIAKKFMMVVGSIVIAFILSVWAGVRIGNSAIFANIGLSSTQKKSDGYISIDTHQKEKVGKEGVAYTVLRPSGRVMVDNELFDAKSEIGYIEKGETIKVIRDEAGQLYVIKKV